jgi:hypothetical protein
MALRIEEQERWVQWLEADEADLRGGPLRLSWRNRYPDLTGTERECQDQAVSLCGEELEGARGELAALKTQAAPGEAARRPEQGETR